MGSNSFFPSDGGQLMFLNMKLSRVSSRQVRNKERLVFSITISSNSGDLMASAVEGFFRTNGTIVKISRLPTHRTLYSLGKSPTCHGKHYDQYEEKCYKWIVRVTFRDKYALKDFSESLNLMENFFVGDGFFDISVVEDVAKLYI
jgi:ribosomal protein S10